MSGGGFLVVLLLNVWLCESKSHYHIVLRGENPVTLPVSDRPYEDAGAHCILRKNGGQENFDSEIFTSGSVINPGKIGTYVLQFRCEDAPIVTRRIIITRTACSGVNMMMGPFQMGRYKLTTQAHSHRAVYTEEKGGKFLYYDGTPSFGLWLVGPKVGGYTFSLRATDPASSPDEITETWELWDKQRGSWIAEPNVKSTCNEGNSREFCKMAFSKACGGFTFGSDVADYKSCIDCATENAARLSAAGCIGRPEDQCRPERKDMLRDGEKPCKVSRWYDWSDCTKTCGIGSQTRTRSVVDPGVSAASCPPLRSVRMCNPTECPWVPTQSCVEGVYTGDWSACNTGCGTGKKFRWREEIRCLSKNHFRPLKIKRMETKKCQQSCDKDPSYFHSMDLSPAGLKKIRNPVIPPLKNIFTKERTDVNRIKLIGPNPLMIKVSVVPFQDPGAYCVDPITGASRQDEIHRTGPHVNTFKPGKYKIWYHCGNSKVIFREVVVSKDGCKHYQVDMGPSTLGTMEYTNRVHGGRPVYRDPKGKLFLFYTGTINVGKWTVAEGMDASKAKMQVVDPAVVPDDIVNDWSQWQEDQSMWEATPSFKIRCVMHGDEGVKKGHDDDGEESDDAPPTDDDGNSNGNDAAAVPTPSPTPPPRPHEDDDDARAHAPSPTPRPEEDDDEVRPVHHLPPPQHTDDDDASANQQPSGDEDDDTRR